MTSLSASRAVTILVVDDTPANLFPLVDALEERQMQVSIASDGVEALQRAAALKPDLVLLDMMMPKLDGLETCRRLKADPATADIPVIFMTALADVGQKTSGFAAGGVDYITKPFQIDEVLARVTAQLALVSAHRDVLHRYQSLEQQTLARRRTDVALGISERRLRGLFETSPIGLILFDLTSGEVLDVNPELTRMLRVPRERLVGRPIEESPLFVHLPQLRGALAALRHAGRMPATQCVLRPRDGATIHLEIDGHVHQRNGPGGGGPGGGGPGRAGSEARIAQLALRDVTERRIAEERIQHMAMHDSLTGLPNRTMFDQHLARAIDRAAARHRQMALLLLDIDRFKLVNDAMGHRAGDMFLRRIADRISATLPPSCLAARLGNDEFAVVLDRIVAPQEAAALAERLLAELARSVEVEGQLLRTSGSIGISLYPADAVTPEALLQTADASMQSAKRSQRGSYRFATRALAEEARMRAVLAAELREACARQAFDQHYQPQFLLASGAVCGVEALVRWQRENGEAVSPARFVPLLEELGLIAGAGRQVLLRACGQAMLWGAQGMPLRVAVNLSPREFYDANITAQVREALARTGLPPERLELEITESLPVSDTETAIRVMHELKALGIGLALDDFGTGWSSLAYLRRFPLDRIKIDQSFVKDLGTEPTAMTMVRSIVDLAGSLGFACVAEGVETQAQLECLRAIGCAEAQGYLFSRPLPVDACTAVLRQGWPAAAAVGV